MTQPQRYFGRSTHGNYLISASFNCMVTNVVLANHQHIMLLLRIQTDALHSRMPRMLDQSDVKSPSLSSVEPYNSRSDSFGHIRANSDAASGQCWCIRCVRL